MRTRIVALLGALVVATVATACIIPIEDLGGGSSGAVAVNGGAVVVGWSADPDSGLTRGFARLTDRSVVELPPLPGHDSSIAADINDAGFVVGSSWVGSNRSGTQRAVRWSPTGEVTDLGVLAGDTRSAANAINDAGLVVGFSGEQAFVFDPAVGSMVGMAVPSFTDASATDINDDGVVVGHQVGIGTTGPKVWHLEDGSISFPPGASEVRRINDDGWMVGTTAGWDGLGPQSAALWRPDLPEPVDLGALVRADGTSGESFAIAMNELGEVLIQDFVTTGSSPSTTRYFFWSPVTGIAPLDPGAIPAGLNDHGVIVGSSDDHAVFISRPAA